MQRLSSNTDSGGNDMNRIKLGVVFAAVLVWGVILPSSLQAQQAIEDGTIEVAGSVGLNSGVDLTKLLPRTR
jgi:hypothetical protein